MLLYLDASALVKRYVAESGSTSVMTMTGEARAVATSVISQAEMTAALAKAERMGALTENEAAAVVQVFHSEWTHFVRIQATEAVMARADEMAWNLGLCGHVAVHLASALVWQEAMGETVVLATYDARLWHEAAENGLQRFPKNLG